MSCLNKGKVLYQSKPVFEYFILLSGETLGVSLNTLSKCLEHPSGTLTVSVR